MLQIWYTHATCLNVINWGFIAAITCHEFSVLVMVVIIAVATYAAAAFQRLGRSTRRPVCLRKG
jgi:hypothetical protein